MQFDQLRRRECLALLGSSAVWTLTARAQQPAMPVVGYLSTGTPESDAVSFMAPFHEGLGKTGYVQGKNVLIEYRWAEFQYERLHAMAADLTRLSVNAIATIGGTPPALAAKGATSTIPIVIYAGIDLVRSGLIASFNRPGGNVTGIAALQADLIKKRIQVLHEFAPQQSLVAVLVNPKNPYTEPEIRAVREGASFFGLRLHVLHASNAGEIDAAFGAIAEMRAGALLVSADLYLISRCQQFVALSARHALPVVYPWREYVDAGGLMCYGPNNIDANRLIGVYTGKILKGAIPADLPVEQVTKVEFVINLKTAKALGVEFPNALLARADEVIE